MATVTLEDRLIEQLAPIGQLLAELIDAAHSECTVQHVATAFPELRRHAHLSRLSGIAAWAHLADGLVEADGRSGFRLASRRPPPTRSTTPAATSSASPAASSPCDARHTTTRRTRASSCRRASKR